MFIGEYHHNLDAKNRVAIPAKFRDAFDKTAYLTKGMEGCIYIYTAEGFQKYYDSIIALNKNKADIREYQRVVFSRSMDADLDTQGRILINSQFAKMAGITRECVFVGVGDRIELWSEDGWNNFINGITDEKLEQISEEL